MHLPAYIRVLIYLMSSSDFASAQGRIAARRQTREAESQALALSQKSKSQVEAQLAKLPAPLGTVGRAGVSIWDSIKGREGTNPSFRVGQVDAELLDEELLSLLKNQVGDAFKYFDNHLQDDWSDEILLGLRAVLFKLTIWDHDATYGAALQNLKFTDARIRGPILSSPTKIQKALYGLLSVGGSYAWSRWEHKISDIDSSYDVEPSPMMRKLSNLTSRLGTTYSIAALGSFLVFLVNGRYRTLLDRILRMRLAPPTSQVSREVSFEYLNRQLVWHAFTEFLLFLLPLVGISRWRRWLANAWKRTKSIVSDPSAGETDEKKGELAHLPERTCAICYQDQNTAKTEAEIIAQSASAVGNGMTDITNPYEGECGDVYCFVCIASRLEAEGGEGWTCLRCGKNIKECRPWAGDVLPEVTEKKGSKTVGFSDGVGEESGMVVVDPVEDEEEYDGEAARSEIEEGSEEGENDAYGEGSEANGSDAYEEDEDMDDVPDFDE